MLCIMFKNYQIETISSQAPHKKVKVQRLVERRRAQVSSKWETSQVDEDIVCSIWKHIAVHNRTCSN